MSTTWRFWFPFVCCWGTCVFSTGLSLPSWNNTVLVVRHLHPLKTNRKFDFYRSNYGGFASPPFVLLCRKHANRALRLTLPCSNRDVNDYSYLRENDSLKSRKSQRYSVYTCLNNLFSISCVFENTQYLNQIVSLNTFSHPLRSMYFTFLIPVCQYQWWKNINNDSYICICIISAVESIPLLPSTPSSPASSYTAHVQPGAHRILASLPANLLFTSISFFF